MRFFNGVKFEDFIDKEVHLILTSGSDVCDTLPFCRTFLRNGTLWVDLIPQLHKKYVIEVPKDSAFSRNEESLSMGRFGIIIKAESRAGVFILDLLDQNRRLLDAKP